MSATVRDGWSLQQVARVLRTEKREKAPGMLLGAAGAGNNLLANPESQTGTDVLLGGKERLEHAALADVGDPSGVRTWERRFRKD
jgi:hypothetical protein